MTSINDLIKKHWDALDALELHTPEDMVDCPLCESGTRTGNISDEFGCPLCAHDEKLPALVARRYHEAELEILGK